jgi:radical SAM protein with 4Fe4S-binding SPASM domain
MKEVVQKDRYSQIFKKTMEKNILLIVHWELTYRCNLSCPYCYCIHDKKRKELTLEEIKRIMDKLAEMKCLFITFSGGEIFMRKDFFAIARYARSKGFALRLMTNGTLITDKVADYIREIEPLSVEMSLYASDAELHDRMIGENGSFDKTIKAFELLRESGIKTVVKSLLMKPNAHELDRLRKIAARLGATFAYDTIVVPKNDGTKDPLSFRLEEEEMVDIFRSQKDVSNFKPSEVVDDDTFMCSAALNNISISPYGDVYPCVALKEKAGNLREQSLEEIQNSPVLRKVRSTKFTDLLECKRCDLAAYCNRCPGLSLMEDGDFLGPSTATCRMASVWKRLSNEIQVKGGIKDGEKKPEKSLCQPWHSV